MMIALEKSVVRPSEVGQSTLAEYGKQDVEHFRVGLLDLVQENHGERLAADRAVSKPSGCANVPTDARPPG